ncbi:carboxypeptidase-like regulatory domain-containing protein [Wocania ichthyoenteri]|uniref:carboxypeptidase-like regulatory domain-containing protein n=1 Tax=Wocania ichthyoenteri TaxID=1230531 RepID=UPI00053E291B|nr:carboxypeptidase-like regulatory domain-containing protein [Wocania ichthyoenteri]
MRHIICIAIFLVTAFSFAQHTGSVTGYVLDNESNNAPLIYAKVLIKETGSEVLSDEKGLFKFENLKDGNYTLVSSFVGHETKALEVQVESGKAIKVKISLGASSVSLEELMLTFASADKENTSPSLNK